MRLAASRCRPSEPVIGSPRRESPSAASTSQKRAFGYVMLLVADAQLGDEHADRVEDRVQRIAIAGQDHPGGQRSCAFPAEGVERAVDDLADVLLADARPLDRFGDSSRDPVGDRPCELGLKPCRRPEVMKQVGVRSPNFCRDRLQRDRLWPLVEQQHSRRFQCG